MIRRVTILLMLLLPYTFVLAHSIIPHHHHHEDAQTGHDHDDDHHESEGVLEHLLSLLPHGAIADIIVKPNSSNVFAKQVKDILYAALPISLSQFPPPQPIEISPHRFQEISPPISFNVSPGLRAPPVAC